MKPSRHTNARRDGDAGLGLKTIAPQWAELVSRLVLVLFQTYWLMAMGDS